MQNREISLLHTPCNGRKAQPAQGVKMVATNIKDLKRWIVYG
jgi:hypothetical protein